MKDLIQAIKMTDYTPVIMFGVFMLAIILLMELHDKNRKNTELYYFNGNSLKNDYDPIAFRIIIAVVMIIFVAIGVITYNLATK